MMASAKRRYRRPAYLVHEYTYTISQPEAAELLRVPISKLAAWRRRNEGPFWVKRGPYIRYSWEDLTDYLSKLRKGDGE
jgi:hypothetical protein